MAEDADASIPTAAAATRSDPVEGGDTDTHKSPVHDAMRGIRRLIASAACSLSPNDNDGDNVTTAAAAASTKTGGLQGVGGGRGGGHTWRRNSLARTSSSGSNSGGGLSKRKSRSMRRNRSLSPIRFLRQAAGADKDHKNHHQHPLHIVPEAWNESSSGSIHFMSNSWAVQQEQMVQAFAALTTSASNSTSASASATGDSLVLEVSKDSQGKSGRAEGGGGAFPNQIQVKTKRRSYNKKRNSNPPLLTVPDSIQLVDAIKNDDAEDQDNDATLVNYSPSNAVLLSLPQQESSPSHPLVGNIKKGASLDEYLIREQTTPSATYTHIDRRPSFTRHSATSSTIASGVSQISFHSMASFNSLCSSMPSLSSIVEHDLQSVATAGTGGNSILTATSSIGTSFTGSGDLPSLSEIMNDPGKALIATGSSEHPIILSLAPPPGEATRKKAGVAVGRTSSYCSSSNSSLNSSRTTNSSNNSTRMKTAPNVSDHLPLSASNSSFNFTTPDFHRELYYLAGTTLDELGGSKIQNPHKNLPQERWESDMATKKKTQPPPTSTSTTSTTTNSTTATGSSSNSGTNTNGESQSSSLSQTSSPVIDHGNRDVAPLTHDQKNMLPNIKRVDVEPIYVARRGSDASSSAQSIATLLQVDREGGDCGGVLGKLLEYSPDPMARQTVGQRYGTTLMLNNTHPNSGTNQDTAPTVARRMSSNSTMTSPLLMGSGSRLLDSPGTSARRFSSSLDSSTLMDVMGGGDEDKRKDVLPDYYLAAGALPRKLATGPAIDRSKSGLPRTRSSGPTFDRSNGLARTRSSDSFGLPPKPIRPVSPPSIPF